MIDTIDDPYKTEPTKPTPAPKFSPLDRMDLRVLKYVPREIHCIKGEASHGIMAHMAGIIEQEKFRADVRFPHYQMMQRIKRMKSIINGKPGLPIFNVVNYGGPGEPA